MPATDYNQVMSDDSQIRHARQRSLPQIGSNGQLRLASSHALIIGLGGLGTHGSGAHELALTPEEEMRSPLFSGDPKFSEHAR